MNYFEAALFVGCFLLFPHGLELTTFMKKLSLTLASREIMWVLRKILQPFVDTNLAQRNVQTVCPGWWIESCSVGPGSNSCGCAGLMDITCLGTTPTKMLRRVFAGITQHTNGPGRSPKPGSCLCLSVPFLTKYIFSSW